MTQPHLLQPQSSVDDFDFHGQLLAQPPPCLQYNQQFFTSLPEYNGLDPMSDSILRGHYSSDSYTQLQPWVSQRSDLQHNKPSVSTCSIPGSSLTYPPGQSWHGASGLSGAFDWQGAFQGAIQQLEPYIMPEVDDQFRRNQELVYNPIAAQNTVVKGINAYGDGASWSPSGVNGLPRGASTSGSDADSNNSLSPKSYISDDLEHSYSPGPMSDYASPVVNFHGYPKGSPNNGPPSHFGSYPVQKMEDNTHLPMSSNMAMAVVSSTRFKKHGDTITTFEDTQQSGSEYSFSQGSSPRASSWYAPNYSHQLSGLPLRQRDTQGHMFHSASDTSLSSANNDRSTQYRSAPRADSRANTSTHNRMQDRFQVPRNADTQAQRQENDRLLLEGKQNGWTYKMIRGMIKGEQPAESTLRGRYRSLTKDRKDRVRKPVWTKTDVDLLNQVVEREFDRIECNLQNPNSLSFDQKLVKVPWKKVAEYIDEQGGSYHFGNSTCKRKWLEVNPRRK